VLSPTNIFYPLSPRLTVLLSTIFAQGGEGDLHLINYLDEEDAEFLRERAEALSSLDGRQRAAIIAAEMRRQFQFRGVIGLDQVDATWLLAGLRGEHPQTIGIIISQLSAHTRGRILSSLPPEVAAKVPKKEELRNLKLEVMRVVRQLFEAKFATMPMPPSEPTNFYFKDIVLLDHSEILQLVNALGVEELGAAFLTVGRRKLAELCQKLGNDAAELLVAAVRQTAKQDAMPLEEANALLQRMLVDLKNDGIRPSMSPRPSGQLHQDLFRSAGLLRLAKATSKEKPTVLQQLAQKLPRGHGRLLRSYVDKIDDLFTSDDRKIKRLQDLILYRVEKLAARGKIKPELLSFAFCYWGEETEEDPSVVDGDEVDEEYYGEEHE
jgi:hypothetical protein